jgi:DNA invertase Pin-like site-specific DNA recombinase
MDQNEKRQPEGQILERVFTDKASARNTARPQRAELLRFARQWDKVVVQRGAYNWRKKTLSPRRPAELVQHAGTGVPKLVLARDYGISRETVYQYLRHAKLA